MTSRRSRTLRASPALTLNRTASLREFLQLLPRPVRQVLFVQHPDEVGPVPARLLAVFPSIYRSAYEDAERRDELKEYAKSFRLNVGCACAIEHDIRACAIGNGLQAGCVDMTLERYGFQRVSFVLANSLCKMSSAMSRSSRVPRHTPIMASTESSHSGTSVRS